MTVDWIRAFPSDLAPVVGELSRSLPPAEFEMPGLITKTGGRDWPAVTIGGEPLEIEYRVYHKPLADATLAARAERERTILACMYSRHHDGRVRQRVLPYLLNSREAFVSPFLVQLLGEYVLEIIVEIADRLGTDEGGEPLLTMMRGFARENPGLIELTTARARSYWAEYYRRDFLWSRDYPGLIALARITG